MQSEELRPCPFCGRSASIESYGDSRQSTIYRCDNCSCSLETGEEFNHGAQWNRRADDELQVCRERRYAFALPNDELAKDARELLTELDSFNGMEYDSDSEVACQRAHSIITALLERSEPPAPSVAVKALRWKGPDGYGEYHSLDGLWGYIIRCEDDGHWLTEVGDYFPSPEAAKVAAQADYEARIRSALSAQVQDVAGNANDYYGNDPAELKQLLAQRDKWLVDNDHWHDFTRSLPAAPAKQEGGHD